MKKIKNISLLSFLTFICVVGVFTSCKEDMELKTLPNLFRPINFSCALNKTVATISWAAVDSAVSYTLQVSTDSTFKIPAKMVVDTTVAKLSFTKELAGETTFYAQIRANASDVKKNSFFNSKFSNGKLSFVTPKENLFLGYGTKNNTGNVYSAYMTDVSSLDIKWTPGANVSHLILISADGLTRDSVTILPAEAAAGDKLVKSLANSSWKVEIYNGIILRGTTKGTVEGDVILKDGDNLQSALAAATPGQIIILAGTGNYPIGSGAYSFNNNIKLRGISPVNRPVVCMTGAAATAVMFAFGPNPISYIKMENIDFTGYNDNNNSGTEIQYMINNGTAAKVSNLSFTNCKIHDFVNTPFRLKNGVAQVIDTLAINGCIINNVGFGGTYAVVNSNTNDLFNTIIFSNTTVYNFKNSLILRTGSTLNSVSIVNCNINQGMQDAGSARYLMDLNTATFNASTGGGVTIKNCIFGQTAAPNTTIGANGFRGTVTPVITGSYYTTDYLDDPIPAGVTSTSIKSKISPYPGTSNALWNDPVKGDFKLKDTSFTGKGLAGDLRYY